MLAEKIKELYLKDNDKVKTLLGMKVLLDHEDYGELVEYNNPVISCKIRWCYAEYHGTILHTLEFNGEKYYSVSSLVDRNTSPEAIELFSNIKIHNKDNCIYKIEFELEVLKRLSENYPKYFESFII